MADKFPIIHVFKGALFGPLAYIPGLIKSYLIVGIAIAVVYFYGTSQGLSMEIIQGFADPAQAEGLTEYAGAFLKAFMLALLLVGGASAFVFNFWVRFGASGAEGVAFPSAGDTISAMLLNMVKFFFIFLLIGIVTVVVAAILTLAGVGPDEAEQSAAMASGDLRAMTLSGIAINLINLVIVCAIYSWFSANLTQTALKSQKEGLEHPHTVDFGIVIFLIYMVVFIPSLLAGLTGSWTLSIAVQLVVGTYVAFSIAVAHGIRYSICTAETVEG